MSKRFLRWVETWIEENIPPGANPDIESHDAKTKRLSEKLFAEAAAAGFANFEIDEERERVPPLVLTAVSDSTDLTSMPIVLSRNLRRKTKMAIESARNIAGC